MQGDCGDCVGECEECVWVGELECVSRVENFAGFSISVDAVSTSYLEHSIMMEIKETYKSQHVNRSPQTLLKDPEYTPRLCSSGDCLQPWAAQASRSPPARHSR